MDEIIEFIPPDKLKELQLSRLKGVIERVYQGSNFYQKLFQENNIHPSQITSLKDICRLPLVTRADLRANFPYGFLCVSLEEVVRLHTSTGTTGKPKAIFFTQNDLEASAKLIARAMKITGACQRDVFQNMMSYGLFTGGLIFHYGAEKLGLLVIPAGTGNTERQIELMRDFQTTIVHLTPSYALYLADVIEDLGLNPRDDLHLRLAYLGAEPHSEETRARVEEIFGIKAYDSYGLSEMNGPGVAFECPYQQGMHLWEDSFLMEIIDPDTGEPRREGEEGELILTSLNREAMPIIRYRTGDLTYIYPESCPCGRTHRRIARIKGRVDDMFILRGVNVFPSEVERILMGIPEVGRNYQIVLEREKSKDKMRVRVEVEKRFFDGSLEHLRALEQRIKSKIKTEILVTPEIELIEPGSLPRTSGKSRRVIDRRQI